MVKVKSSFSFNGEVYINEVVSSRYHADYTGDEKHEPLYAFQRGQGISHYTSHNQPWKHSIASIMMTKPKNNNMTIFTRANHDQQSWCYDHLPVLFNFWMFPPKLFLGRSTVISMTGIGDERCAVLRCALELSQEVGNWYIILVQ